MKAQLRHHPVAQVVLLLGLTTVALTLSSWIALGFMCVVIAVVAYATALHEASWNRFKVLLAFAAFLVMTRVLLQNIFGYPMGSSVLFELPTLEMPSWFAGLRVGGAVTVESLDFSATEGLKIATSVLLIGAFLISVSPAQILRNAPAVVHHVGLVLVIALSFVPQLLIDAMRLRQASRWRGLKQNALSTIAINLNRMISSALERSVTLAAALTLRGYQPVQGTLVQKRLLAVSSQVLAVSVGLLILVGSHLLINAMMLGALAIFTYCINQLGMLSQRTRFSNSTYHVQDFFIMGLGFVLAILSLSIASEAFLVAASITSILIALFIIPSLRSQVNS